MQAVKDILYGVVFGVANVIPGVSGGTIGVIFGFYDKLLQVLGLKQLKKNIPFILCFGLGGAGGILLFSKAIGFLLERYPIAVNFAFIGLILGSIPMIFRRAVRPSPPADAACAAGSPPSAPSEKDKAPHPAAVQGARKAGTGYPLLAVCFLLALGLMLLLGWINTRTIENTLETQLTAGLFFRLLAVSAVSAFAMILPGISGSLVMLILGSYTTVITAVSQLNLPVLVPVALGCLIGLVAGSRLVDGLMRARPQETYAAILGLIVGSLFSIYPGFAFTWEGLAAVLLLVLCGFTAWKFSVSEG